MVSRKITVGRITATATLAAACASLMACQPIEENEEPEAPNPQTGAQPVGNVPPAPQCDEVKTKCSPQGGFPQSLVDACKTKYEKGDPSICIQTVWPMELYNELNNAVASGGGDCVRMYVSGTAKSGPSGLSLREKPTRESKDLGGADEGEEVCSLGKEGPDWIKVRYQGKVGYMNRQFLALNPPARASAAAPSGSTSRTPTKPAPAAASNNTPPSRDCSKYKDTVACKVIRSNQNCWLQDQSRVYNGMPVVDDDLTMVTTGQVACYERPQTIRLAWGPWLMHRPALMRKSPELNCWVETVNLLCP
jgi:hypothetical protein